MDSDGEETDQLSWYRMDLEPWDANVQKWNQSRCGLGIIKSDGKLYFDLWRGRSCVQGYIAISDERRKVAARLYRIAREFRDLQPEPTRAMSCLLMDAPGRGKSSLVKGVAKTLGMEFREIDVSQLTEPADLANRLDGIITDQIEVRRRFLLFVDEIDSEDGRWYGKFLAPLESGYYVRGGSRFYVRPCVWVFAGSTRTNPTGNSPKLPDFKSRLTHGEMHLSSPVGSGDVGEWERRERLERVYIAVSMLRSRFPHLRYLTPEVLFAFYSLNLSMEVRRIRHLIEGIVGLTDDRLFARHVYGVGGEFSSDLPPLSIREIMDNETVILRDLP